MSDQTKEASMTTYVIIFADGNFLRSRDGSIFQTLSRQLADYYWASLPEQTKNSTRVMAFN